MEKDLNISILLDFYGSLLTEKQYTALDMYHNMDYSLAEISENLSVTRQCARDFIKKGESKLLQYEDMLRLSQKIRTIATEADKIRDLLSSLPASRGEIEKSLDIISNLC
ncbi:MAG: DNA-binding protein [Clostridia bacterium]|nr:DNA-binding protein [Clostridia bacterium]